MTEFNSTEVRSPPAGGLALCGPIGGAPMQGKVVGDFKVIFDTFYPDVFPFGAATVPDDAWQDWEGLYAPAVETAILGDPMKRYQLFNVTDAAWDPTDPDTAVTTAQTVLRYTVVGTNDVIDLGGGQNPYNNIDYVYKGSFNDWALNDSVERVDGDPAYFYEFYETTGDLSRPLVTMHTMSDGAVPFRHEMVYYDKVRSQGAARNLTVIPVMRYGHCTFEAEEILGAFAWLFIRVHRVEGWRLMPYLQEIPMPMP